MQKTLNFVAAFFVMHFAKPKQKNPFVSTNNDQRKHAYANQIKSNLACVGFIFCP